MTPAKQSEPATQHRRSWLTGLLWVGIGFFIGHCLREEPDDGLLVVATICVVLGLIGCAITWRHKLAAFF